MVTLREQTSSYPDNLRSEWAIQVLRQPVLAANGLWEFEYAVYASARSLHLGDRPFVYHSTSDGD